MNDTPRINNRIEGWHRHFIGLSSTVHPSIFQFVNLVKRDMDSSAVKLQQFYQGHTPQPTKAIYQNQTMRIKNILRNNDSDL